MSLIVFQSSRWGRESTLLDFCCVLNVMSLLSSVTLPHGVMGWSVVCVCGHSHLPFGNHMGEHRNHGQYSVICNLPTF